MTNTTTKDEELRLKTLEMYHILDTENEPELDEITEMAATIFDCKVALISLVDSNRIWFKSKFGTELSEVNKIDSFCEQAIHCDDIFIVEDAGEDTKFCTNSLFVNDPHFRFYASAPLIAPNSQKIGSICLLDPTTKKFGEREKKILRSLANQVISYFEMRIKSIDAASCQTELIYKDQKLVELLQLSNDALMTLAHPTWQFTSCNNAALKLFGIESEEAFKRMGPWDISPERQPDGELSTEKAKKIIQKTLEEGSQSFEWMHSKPNGEKIPCLVSTSKIQEGNQSYIHAAIRDFSKQKELEKQLMSSNEYLELALEGAGLGIWDWYLKTNKVIFDKRWAQMIGLDVNEIDMELHTWESRVHPDDLEPCYAAMKAYLNGETDYYENIHRMKHRLGHWVYILDRGRYSEWDENGEPIRFTGTHFDITETKEQEKELSLILEKNKIGIWKFDPNTNALTWDQGMYDLYGINKDDFSGAYDAWSSSLHPDYLEKAQKELAFAISDDKPFDTVFAIKTPKGEIKYIQARAIIERDRDGRALMMIGVNSDVTREQLAFRKAEEASQVKSEFLANMSHEIRTPMNGVLGMLHNLKDTKLDKEQSEILEIIEISSKNLMGILNDILDLSKLEAGKISLESIPFDINNSFSRVIQLMDPLAAEKGNILDYNINQDKLVYVIGDSLRITQIITNLLSNAVKFTKNGKVSFKYHSQKLENDHLHFKVTITDTGIGIKDSHKENLFNDFVQEDSSISRRYGGTGLGLSICSKLASLMNGKIYFESTENVGSTFYFEFTLPEGHPIEKVKDDSKLLSKNFAKQHPHKILLVEDNKINQKVALLTLSKLGYDCDVAENGLEALDTIEHKGESYYDLILMDMQMPKMDGIEATQKIIELYGDGSPKIIALTANAFDTDRQKCIEVGMKGFLTKPIENDKLLTILDTSQ